VGECETTHYLNSNTPKQIVERAGVGRCGCRYDAKATSETSGKNTAIALKTLHIHSVKTRAVILQIARTAQKSLDTP